MRKDSYKLWQAADSEAKRTPKRSEVDPASTWDLTPIYASDDAWEAAFAKTPDYLNEIAPFREDLTQSGDRLLDFSRLIEQQIRELEKLYVYASMRNDEDTSVSKYSGMQARIGLFLSQYGAAIAFSESAIADLEDEKMEAFYRETAGLDHYRRRFDKIRASKPHLLSAETEEILAGASHILGGGEAVFSVLDNADQKFPLIEDEEGHEIEINHANYGLLIESRDRRVRKDTFEQYYTVYNQYRNTYAKTLELQVNQANYLAQVHKFASAREAALFGTEVPESVYDNLVDTVNKNLPMLHRYVALRKRLLGLDEIHNYDLHVPVVPNVELKYSMEEAEEIIKKALAPMGEDYLKILDKAFSERWIDYAVNEGKRSGAYSGGCYDSNPYILMSWQGNLNNLYTLAHELGHSCHSYLSRRAQDATYADYPIFLAEIASTCNENLLTHYLLATIDDQRVRRYIIMNYLDGFKGTVFRQTQFAEFELFIHQQSQEGKALTADFLKEAYGELNARYYGPELARDPEIALEWARIPHFYYNFYVYQYATGFSAATAFAEAILGGGTTNRDAYLTFLSSGCSDKPIPTLQKAGVDMTSPQPVDDAMKAFEHYLSLLEQEA